MRETRTLVIVGPTASGKSALAVRLAKKFGGEIISADSRQVYKGLDIGTGKITKKEMRGVRHHLLDVVDPKKQFSVAEYKKLVEEKIRKIKFPVVVGGTGFYIDTLTGSVTLPSVPPNKILRKKLDKKSAGELYQMLEKKDPRRAQSIDRRNKVRLIRALEIVAALGKVPSLKHRAPKNFIFIGIKPDKLEKRIYERLLLRLKGMIVEAKNLHARGLSYKRMHELGLEYRFLSLYLQKKISEKELVQKLNIAIRQYAKRQLTWFKRNPPERPDGRAGPKIKWFKPSEFGNIEKYISRSL